MGEEEKKKAEMEIREIQSMKGTWSVIAGFEGRGRGQGAKKCRWSLEGEYPCLSVSQDTGTSVLQGHRA